MSLETVQNLLARRIGLNPRTVSSRSVDRAIKQRMTANGETDVAEYVEHLARDTAEMDALIEAVVIPETWFFRDMEPFVFLAHYVRREWIPKHNVPLKVLSVPCSTGEEPYSIVMTLLDAGLNENRFIVDAVDISQDAIARATNGIYSRSSFREIDRGERQRYFRQDKTSWTLSDAIRKQVRFSKGNILESLTLAANKPYDIVFCRNLLIYLDEESRKRATTNIDLLLADEGLVFLGYAETRQHFFPDYLPETHSRCYATRKVEKKKKEPVKPPLPVKKSKTSFTLLKPAGSAKRRRKPDIAPAAETRAPEPTTSQASSDSLARARELADSGHVTEAEAICHDILSRDITEANAHFLLGIICLARNDEEQATRHLDKAVYLDPCHQDALTQLGLIMDKTGRPEQAARYRQRLVRLQNRESGM